MPDIKINAPIDEVTALSLQAGDRVRISGTVYTARDAAHKRMIEQLEQGIEPPIPLQNQVIYYVGPTPSRPGQIIGSAGPTTSGRMDKYTPALLEAGLRGMIGKGYRSREVKEAIVRHKAVYFAAIGGTGALLSRAIRSVEILAYDDLGPEAIRKLVIEDFPCVVINDCHGNDWYEQAVNMNRLSE